MFACCATGDLEGAERMAGVAAGLAAEGEDDKDCRLHATVLRLEARKCHDDSLKMKDGEVKKDEEKDEASADKEQDAKLAEMAQNLESHASIVEPQAPSAPMNRSPEHAMRNVSCVDAG